jgi:RHS repeat-associated protein
VLVKYDAYGNIYNTSAGDLNLPFRFAGMRYEKDADIYLTPNRAYSPALGRWLQVDPLGTLPNPKQGNRFAPLDQYTDGQNLYEYCSGDPVNSADMLGLVWDPYGGAGGGYTDWTPTDGDINNESDFFDAFVIHWIYGMGATFTQGANVVKAQKDLKTGTSSLLMKLANIYCDELKATGKLRTNGNVIEEGKSWARVSDNWYMRATLNGPSLSYRVRGTYSAENKCSLCKVTFNLQYTWLDRGDLNYHNLSDLLLEIVTLRKLNPAHWFGLAYQDFPININWSDTAVIGHTKSGGSWEILKGWPVEGFYGDYK